MPQKKQLGGNIRKPYRNRLKINIPSIGVDIESYLKFGLILILISWGFVSKFISAAETLPSWTLTKHFKIHWNFTFYVLGSILNDILNLGLFGNWILEFTIGGLFLPKFDHTRGWVSKSTWTTYNLSVDLSLVLKY